MKIAVVGPGALGGYYGAKLCRAGQEIHFLLRSDYEVVRRQGWQVHSPEGNFRVHPKCARDAASIGVSDLVLVCLKTTANHQFPQLLPPLVGSHTALLTLQNGLGNEERLAEIFSPQQILGGLCFVCLNRTAPGTVHHLDHGRIVLGEFQRYPEPRTHDIASLLRHAGVPCQVTENLAQAHWEKLVWNIPFNGLGVAASVGHQAMTKLEATTPISPGPVLTTQELLADPIWEQVVRELMVEVIQAARALGYPVLENLVEGHLERTRTMGPYKASTLIDFERGQPLELDSLFREPLRQAKAAGLPMPRLEALCRVLERLAPPGSS